MRKLTMTSIVATTLLLIGCGGGGSSSNTPTKDSTSPVRNNTINENVNKTLGKGYYVDEAVQGVDYKCGTQSGITDENGTFIFESGQNCNFSLGNIKLREINASTLEDNISIIEDNIDVAKLLQTLDKDGNASNGIQILNNTSKILIDSNIDSIPTDDALLDMIHENMKAEYQNEYNGTVVKKDKAEAHLEETKHRLEEEGRITQHSIKENNITDEIIKDMDIDTGDANSSSSGTVDIDSSIEIGDKNTSHINVSASTDVEDKNLSNINVNGHTSSSNDMIDNMMGGSNSQSSDSGSGSDSNDTKNINGTTGDIFNSSGFNSVIHNDDSTEDDSESSNDSNSSDSNSNANSDNNNSAESSDSKNDSQDNSEDSSNSSINHSDDNSKDDSESSSNSNVNNNGASTENHIGSSNSNSSVNSNGGSTENHSDSSNSNSTMNNIFDR